MVRAPPTDGKRRNASAFRPPATNPAPFTAPDRKWRSRRRRRVAKEPGGRKQTGRRFNLPPPAAASVPPREPGRRVVPARREAATRAVSVVSVTGLSTPPASLVLERSPTAAELTSMCNVNAQGKQELQLRRCYKNLLFWRDPKELEPRPNCYHASMAECDPLESLQKEASCSICLDYFSDPVSINCGHSFCRDCITRCSGKSDRRFACPQCRGIAQKRKFRPNRELRNLAEIAKKLSSWGGYAAGAGSLCPKHQEPLKLFCREDGTAICVVCDRSHAHRAHTVAPIEEAAQECKEQIQSKLKSLKDERERLRGLKLTGEKRSQKYLQQTRAERWKIMLVFKQLHQFQDEQERLLLMWLEDVEKEIVQSQTENDRKVSEEISHLGDLIREMEEMNPQPENKSLQDARSALTRCEARTFQQLTEKFPRVEKRLKDLSQKNIVLKEALRKFKESLPVELDVQWANVTLDPDTANPHLVLSEDRRSVRWDETPQNLPNNPQRFDTYCSVLGCEGFTAGRHYWEVQLGSRGFWAVGVARDSAWRKGWINLDPSQGIWAVGICGDRFQAFTSFETVQALNGRPRTIRVSLDYEKGHVAFFDANNETLAFAFPPTSFNGEKILPFFWVWESRIQLAP